ncbi:hypothetical protein IW249_001683 [Micromonospora vinacea]|uniref:Uncharacterized protein n=1 Tax=Micromonospora vinacea TaxID=709878 RepID=A0ABS0JY23_9ACTN|nr:hypothetical protein [Micromonospora vinacea]
MRTEARMTLDGAAEAMQWSRHWFELYVGLESAAARR